MNQAELFQEEKPVPDFEHGGYMPPAVQIYRGQEIPCSYEDGYGMATLRLPVLLGLMDLVLDALAEGPLLARDVREKALCAVNTSTLARHLHLMEIVGLISSEPVYFGDSSPHLGNYKGFQILYSLPEGAK